MNIRAAQLDDLEQLDAMLYALHAEHHHARPDLCKSPVEVLQEKSMETYLNHPDCLVFVLANEGKCVGFISGSFSEFNSPIHPQVILGCIDEFYIAPESRKQGYGQQLMAKMVQTFQNYGAEKVMVEVYDFNQSALRTYHKQGFDNYIHCLIKSI